MKVIKNIFRIIAYPLLYFGLQIVIAFIYILPIAVYYIIKVGIDSKNSGLFPVQNDIMEELVSKFNIIIIPMIITCIVAFIVICVILKKEWKAEKFWNVKHTTFILIIQCIVLGTALNIFTTGFLTMFPIPEQSNSLDFFLGDNLILQILSIALLGPFIEEIIFRGIVLKRLTKMMGIAGAVILQAFIFGFVHLNLLQGVYAGLLGIVIGLIYIWFDSIWAAIAVHASYNLTSVLISYFAGEIEINTATVLGFVFASLTIAAAIFAMLINKKPKREIIVYNSCNISKAKGYNRWAY